MEKIQTNNTDSSNAEKIIKERQQYEVVFFVRYRNDQRPSNDEIVQYFSNYGKVHHVNSPEGRNFAFIFMTKLSTTQEQRRTRSTISQIIAEMPENNRFHITVASSNRRPHQPPNNMNRNNMNRNNMNRNNMNRNNMNRNIVYQTRTYRPNNENNGENASYRRNSYQRHYRPTETRLERINNRYEAEVN